MTTLREAAQDSLRALLLIQPQVRGAIPRQDVEDAIDALKAALAEPVQEPVATVTECEACFTPDVCQLRGTCDYYTASQMRIAAPQQQAEPVQEPFGYLWPTGRHPEFRFTQQKRDGVDGMPLYTAPPQREPLTPQQATELVQSVVSNSDRPIGMVAYGLLVVRAVERAHGIGGGDE